MCKCTPEIRTPFCGNFGCEYPDKKCILCGKMIKDSEIIQHIESCVCADPIFNLLNCYEIDGSEIRRGMAHIDSSEARHLTIKIREIFEKEKE